MKRNAPFIKRFPRMALAAIAILATPSLLSAAPVSPEKARSEAEAFLVKPAPGRKALPAASAKQLSLVKTYTCDTNTCYYIFNHESGFVIVSADDRFPAILGYSDNGAFDENRIPDNMKWWLSQYAGEISYYIPLLPDVIPDALNASGSNTRTPIEPLTKTKWDQGAPYNNDCPLDRNNSRCVTGCVATATAQLMKFHNWPDRPTGSNAGVIFSGTSYEWENMLDVYERGKYSTVQGGAVAKLMRQVGAAVNMQYSSYASGAYDFDVQLALPKYFKYSQGLTMNWKDYTPQSEWNDIVYAELAAGRPLYYSGSSSQGGHAFICDGYSSNEYFHFNWGWGGYEDGYFLLSALNPASGGAGSYEGGYNTGQSIITGIMPASKNPNAKKQAALLSSGAFIYNEKDNTFDIAESSMNVNIIYNPLGYDQTLNIGLHIVGAGKTVYDDYSLCESGYTIKSLYGFSGLEADITGLQDGVYHISPSYCQPGTTDWIPVRMPLGKQTYVTLTVKDGVYSYTNDGPDTSVAPHLIVGKPTSTSVIYSDTTIPFRIPILNVGKGDYNETLGFSLFDANDEFGDVASYEARVAVAAESFNNLEVVFTSPLKSGTYKADLLDTNNKYYFKDLKFVVKESGFKAPEGNKVEISDLSPSFYTSGTNSPVYFTASNNDGFANRIEVKIQLLDFNTQKPIRTLDKTASAFVQGLEPVRIAIAPFNLGIDPGEYLWRIVDENNSPLSIPYPLVVTSPIRQSGDIAYVVTDEVRKQAIITPTAEGDYKAEKIVISPKVNGYTITGLRNDAFTFAQTSDITLPALIGSLPAGAFYSAANLKSLTFEGDRMVWCENDVFNRDLAYGCLLNVDSSALANQFAYSHSAWAWFKQPFWMANLKDVEIASGLITNSETGKPYNPCYMNADDTATIKFSAPAGMNVKVIVILNKEWVFAETIDPSTPVNLPALGIGGIGEIRAEATHEPVSVDEVAADTDDPCDVFSIDGRLIMSNAKATNRATLPAGLYILSTGRKIMIAK